MWHYIVDGFAIIGAITSGLAVAIVIHSMFFFPKDWRGGKTS